MRNRFTVIALIFLSSHAIGAQQLSKKIVQFVITHPFKAVTGNCPDVQVNGFSIKKANNVYSVAPFSVQIAIGPLTTQNKNRDSNMLEVLGYPRNQTIVGEMRAIEAHPGKNHLTGILKINGKEQPFESDFDLSENDNEVRASGEFLIKLSAFGLERPRLLALSVDDDVKIIYEFLVRME